MGKRVVAIPNPTLLHDHQAELAEVLDTGGYLVSSTISYAPSGALSDRDCSCPFVGASPWRSSKRKQARLPNSQNTMEATFVVSLTKRWVSEHRSLFAFFEPCFKNGGGPRPHAYMRNDEAMCVEYGADPTFCSIYCRDESG